VTIELRVNGPQLIPMVRDDGVGFDTTIEREGQGLRSLQRRAAASSSGSTRCDPHGHRVAGHERHRRYAAASGAAEEIELLKLMVDGHHYKTVAAELGISTNTVSFHLKNIYDKLQVHSTTEAVAKALRERLI
jgi:DNA-binding CsgD family transcriptional regulator